MFGLGGTYRDFFKSLETNTALTFLSRYLMPLGQKMMASSSFQLSLYCVGFFVMIWIAAVMFKSNDILRKKTALKVGSS